jgi:hypothetical protein
MSKNNTKKVSMTIYEELYPELVAEIVDLERKLIEACKPAVCNVCGGFPLSNDRKCICDGIGTEQAELVGLRKEIFKSDQANNEILKICTEKDYYEFKDETEQCIYYRGCLIAIESIIHNILNYER